MAKRMILMLVFMTILVAGLGFVKVRQFQAMADEFAARAVARTRTVRERADEPVQGRAGALIEAPPREGWSAT